MHLKGTLPGRFRVRALHLEILARPNACTPNSAIEEQKPLLVDLCPFVLMWTHVDRRTIVDINHQPADVARDGSGESLLLSGDRPGEWAGGADA